MVAESSELHLMPKRADRAHFFSKAGKRDGAKKSVSLRPKAVLLTPMGIRLLLLKAVTYIQCIRMSA